jgi:small subunit ribosomal protein S17
MADDENKQETGDDAAEQAEETHVDETPEPEAEVTAPVAEEEAVVDEPVAEETVEEPVAEAEETPAEEPAAEAAPEPTPAPAPEPVVEVEPKRKRKRLPRALRHKHSKPGRDKPATRKPIVRTPKPESELGRRQERRGVVVSDKGDKTIVVSVDTTKLHPRYKKVVRRRHKLHAHDEQNAATLGDVVRIVETRPISKTKHWRLAEIVEKAK